MVSFRRIARLFSILVAVVVVVEADGCAVSSKLTVVERRLLLLCDVLAPGADKKFRRAVVTDFLQ